MKRVFWGGTIRWKPRKSWVSSNLWHTPKKLPMVQVPKKLHEWKPDIPVVLYQRRMPASSVIGTDTSGHRPSVLGIQIQSWVYSDRFPQTWSTPEIHKLPEHIPCEVRDHPILYHIFRFCKIQLVDLLSRWLLVLPARFLPVQFCYRLKAYP